MTTSPLAQPRGANSKRALLTRRSSRTGTLSACPPGPLRLGQQIVDDIKAAGLDHGQGLIEGVEFGGDGVGTHQIDAHHRLAAKMGGGILKQEG
jgi:hypothetical protein